MQRALQIAKLGMLLCTCALLIAASVLCFEASLFVKNVGRNATEFTETARADATAITANANRTLNEINRPCGGGHPCGTLADVAKTLGTIRGATGQLEVAAHHEDSRLAVLDAQEAQIFTDTHTLLQRGSIAVDTANATLAGLQPVESQLKVEAQSLNTATQNLSVLLANPQIPAAIAHANSSLAHIDATVADTQEAVHRWLHPSWPRKVWNGIQAFGVDVGRVLF